MATTNKALTARDKAHVRKTARELHAAYEMGEDDSTSETVMLSSGYADVEIYPGEEKFAYVVRHGRTTRVSMSGPTALGWPRKAGRKTATRKKVSSKKTANPGRKKVKATDARARALYNSVERRVWKIREERGDSPKFLPRDFRQLRLRAFNELSRGEYPSLAALDRANERARDANGARYGKAMAKRDAKGQFTKKTRKPRRRAKR